ncbi:MAG: enoyl-CoA hydratase family protein [Planctomycetes bacterium]|nr:enoyl-CoA hydratase family protein [Planctomycetota bacterium]
MSRPQPTTFRYDEDAHGVATIRLDRPERLNALTFASYRELTDTFRALQQRPSVRAVVLTGSGRAFCSGGDALDIISPLLSMGAEELLRFTRLTGELILNMRQLRTPIVAALNGTTCGAGAVMALASDFRLAAPTAKIAFLFTKVGLAGADMGAAFLLPRLVGTGHATNLLMRGHFLAADEALRIGLYHEVVAAESLAARAQQLAEELAAGPQMGLQMTKEMVNRELSMDLASALEAEAQAQALCMAHPDFAEANRAFIEKRPPRFARAADPEAPK